ncbi:hybrid sensor histidine kinase/response regulator [Desulfospira joergensenii]|uniref:hybrid sensor histidine kinase/response regulator n=1 Tax=Desulfospira joergensenii TaxID=53329 RepID=UPI0004095069|nr:ATP-binding protein [Desulfospira joergensenii]
MTVQSSKPDANRIQRLMEQIGPCGCTDVPEAECLTLNQMKTLLAASPAGIGIAVDRVLTWANDNLYAMLGYEHGSLSGKNVRILYPSETEYERTCSQLMSGIQKYGTAVAETRLARKDGSAFDCRIRSSKLDPSNSGKGTVVVVTDISEIKSLQIQLQQAQKMEAIGVLAGGISHDFNNILMGIQGHLSLMRINLTATEKVASHVKQIGKLVGTAAELTNRLLGFARGGKYQIEPMDANRVVSMALDIFRSTRTDILFHESYEENLYTIEGDYSQLEQVCLNLLLNASEAMIEPGEIFVFTENVLVDKDHDYHFKVDPGQYIKIRIKDTGMGMSKDVQKKIFDPFFSTKEAGGHKGRGLGLSTVFGIVKNHGGFIMVESDMGRGADFQVFLPASGTKTSGPEEGSGKTEELDSRFRGSETILLVDEEEEMFHVGKSFLIKLGYKVITARSGIEAGKIYSMYGDEIPLVVLDTAMQKMTVQKVIAEIKKIRKDVKIMVAAGYAQEDREIPSAECNGFIRKPYSMHEFSRALRSVLDQ